MLQEVCTGFDNSASFFMDKSFQLGGTHEPVGQRFISENYQGRYQAYREAAEHVRDMIQNVKTSLDKEAEAIMS